MSERVVIAGVGFAVPEEIRLNTDPIFDWLHAHEPVGVNPFQGYVERRVLAADQDLVDVLVPASRMALNDAGTSVADVDVLTGFASVGLMDMPNPLALLHQRLGLLSSVSVLPIANDYANFTAGLALAVSLVETNRAQNVLVACASNWTRHVDYHSPQCICVGDGAGAVIVSRRDDSERFSWLDSETITESALYGSMFMAGDESITPPDPNGPTIPGYADHAFSWPYFHITDRGRDAFFSFGENAPVQAVTQLLARHSVSPSEITLITHQTSSVLLDYWSANINPGCLLDTLTRYADVPHANLPLTLAARYAEISTRYLVFLTLGVEFSATAMLMERG